MIGKIISHYQILEKIGEGGMGEVYLVEDTKLKRNVALKFLPKEFTKNKDVVERFQREAQAAAALNHPNIVTIYEINEHKDQTYIAMEYVAGQTLKDKIASDPLTIDEVLEITSQICEGLQKAHQAGIVHRDIKPQNIIINKDSQVKILDFGLAKLKGVGQLTKETSTLGTVHYMSPEQAMGKEVDHHTDIWSLGVVLYEMVTGQLPFKGDYEQAIIYSIINEEPGPIKSVRTDISEELIQILTKSLTKDRDKRYLSIEEVIKDLTKLNTVALSPHTSKQRQGKTTIKFLQPKFVIPIVLIIGALSFFTARFFKHQAQINQAKDHLIPEIIKLIDEEKFTEAYKLAERAKRYIPENPLLITLFEKMSKKVAINTIPSGVDIYFKNYQNIDGPWEYLGKSPQADVRIPIGFFRWKFEKNEFETMERASTSKDLPEKIKLDKLGATPTDMVKVPNGNYSFSLLGSRNLTSIELGDYWIDKYEVTNRQFKKFINSGGYQKKEYWIDEFKLEGRIISWEEAISKFIDSTGRPGPSTWEVGTYPEGQDNYPVCGVSWYEAAAYARYSGKELPTIYHWVKAASLESVSHIVPLSNFQDTGAAAVGQYQGISQYGTFDMAGNVKEWCFNATGKDRYILGGAWDEPEYMCLHTDNKIPFDRSNKNGFRCIKYLTGNSTIEIAKEPVTVNAATFDYTKLKPVSEEIFNVFIQLFSYDKTELNSVIESRDESLNYWIKEKISFNASYGNERMFAYLFIPKNYAPPYQTIILFPGASAFSLRSTSEGNKLHSWDAVDFVIKSGRAVLYPIYKSYHERGDGFSIYNPDMSMSSLRDHFIMWRKDLGRSIDYLESRSDIDHDKIGFFGSSFGSVIGIGLLAIEKRLKIGTLRLVGFAYGYRLHPEIAPIDYASRIKIPILVLNGKYDMIFPYKSSQLPMFRSLGTPKEHKRLVLFDVGHTSPRPRAKAIKEVLDWLDHYFGPVKRK